MHIPTRSSVTRNAGFDNPGKALYTTLREFVENALDAAEDISVLPSIDILVYGPRLSVCNARREHVPALEVSNLYGKSAAVEVGRCAVCVSHGEGQGRR